MKVVQSNEKRNPEQIAHEMTSIVDQLKASVQTAAAQGDRFDSIERKTLASVLQIGFQALELLIALQGDGDLGEEIDIRQDKAAQRSQEKSTTKLRSIFGEHTFDQFTYVTGKNKPISLRPISTRLSLPANRWSFLLQEFSQMLGVDQAYDQAMKNLGKIFGSSFSVDTAERINGNMGRSAGEFLADLPLPEAGSEGKFLVASADCKGVPLVKNDSQKVAAFETAKKNPGNRRMATVTSVYSVDPHIRTAEEITAALFREERDEDAVKKPRPKPKNKNTTAHFPELADDGQGGQLAINGIHVGMAWIVQQVLLRRRPGQVLAVIWSKIEWNAAGCGGRSRGLVRAAFQSDHWQTFIDWHMQSEVSQTHPNRDLLQGYTSLAMAG